MSAERLAEVLPLHRMEEVARRLHAPGGYEYRLECGCGGWSSAAYGVRDHLAAETARALADRHVAAAQWEALTSVPDAAPEAGDEQPAEPAPAVAEVAS